MNEKKVDNSEMLENEETRRPAKKAKETDLPDNEHDADRMKAEEVTIDLPDVSEIPGQEHIHVPQMREMQDVTIASDDEEGVGIFGDEEDEDEDVASDDETKADLTDFEEQMLNSRDNDEEDDPDSKIKRAELDKTDNEGDPLNEGSMATDVSGSDLDVSGSEEDDAMEDIGEEDEENNYYSLGGDNNDSLEESKE